MPAFLLPDLGEGLTEAEIVTWRVQAGDVVAVDQTVVEVETAKAVVEVPVPFAGRVTALHGQPGDVLAVGAPLLTVAGRQRPHPARPARTATAARTSRAWTPERRGRRERPGPHRLRHVRPPRRRVASERGGGHSAPTAPAGPPAPSPPSPAPRRPGGRRLTPGPAAGPRRRPGPGGDPRLGPGRPDHPPGRRRGHRRSSTRVSEPSQPGQPGTSPGPGPATALPDGGSAGPCGSRYAACARRSRTSSAGRGGRSPRRRSGSTWTPPSWSALRAALNADESAPKISLLAMLSRYTILGLRRYPELNARIEGDEIVMGPAVHLGFAAQTDRGLMVPVVPDAQALHP